MLLKNSFDSFFFKRGSGIVFANRIISKLSIVISNKSYIFAICSMHIIKLSFTSETPNMTYDLRIERMEAL